MVFQDPDKWWKEGSKEIGASNSEREPPKESEETEFVNKDRIVGAKQFGDNKSIEANYIEQAR